MGSTFAWTQFLIHINPAGDGNCQFVSICDQLEKRTGRQLSHISLRGNVANYLRCHCTTSDGTRMDEFSTDEYYQDWDKHVEAMGQSGFYSDATSLLAIAHIYSVQIVVISSLGPQGTRLISKEHKFVSDMESIFIGHIAEGRGDHYVSLSVPQQFDVEHFLSTCSTKDVRGNLLG